MEGCHRLGESAAWTFPAPVRHRHVRSGGKIRRLDLDGGLYQYVPEFSGRLDESAIRHECEFRQHPRMAVQKSLPARIGMAQVVRLQQTRRLACRIRVTEKHGFDVVGRGGKWGYV